MHQVGRSVGAARQGAIKEALRRLSSITHLRDKVHLKFQTLEALDKQNDSNEALAYDRTILFSQNL